MIAATKTMAQNEEVGDDSAPKQSVMMSHFAQSRSQEESVTIEWKDIYFSCLIKDKVKSTVTNTVYIQREILRDLSGKITSGELLAILGPTGEILSCSHARKPSFNLI